MSLDCKKVENCFKDAQTYLYRLPDRLTENGMAEFAAVGEFTCNRKFKKPFFAVRLKDGTEIKGMLGDDGVKASYPEISLDRSKAEAEAILEKLCAKIWADSK